MKNFQKIYGVSKFCYSSKVLKDFPLFSQEYFLENYKSSLEKTGLLPINLDEKAKVVGVPFSHFSDEDIKKSKEISDYLITHDSSSICLMQIDSSNFIHSKAKANDASLKNTSNGEHSFLFKIEDIVLDKTCFDIYNPKNTNFSFSEFIEKEDKDISKGPEIIHQISNNIVDYIVNEHLLLNFHEMFNILILKILQNKRVYLADIPLNYYKLIIANSLTLKELNKIFEETLKSMKNYKLNNGIFSIFSMLYGHILQLPRDIYLYEIFNQLRTSNKNEEIALYVEMPHLFSFFNYCKYAEKTKLKNTISIEEIHNKEGREFVEKMAILELLFESKSDKAKKINRRMLDVLVDKFKDVDVKKLFEDKLEECLALKKSIEIV